LLFGRREQFAGVLGVAQPGAGGGEALGGLVVEAPRQFRRRVGGLDDAGRVEPVTVHSPTSPSGGFRFSARSIAFRS
jgi:hypothetical protein